MTDASSDPIVATTATTVATTDEVPETEAAAPSILATSAVEFIPGRLYFMQTDRSATWLNQQHRELHFFTFDNDYKYQSFAFDFGPPHIGFFYLFVKKMTMKLQHPKLRNKRIVLCTSLDASLCTNAAFLIAAYTMLHRDLLPMDAAMPLCSMEPEGTAIGLQSTLHVPSCSEPEEQQPTLVPFRDAERLEPTNFFLSILDCLEGLHRAVKLGWFDLESFKCKEYFFHEKPCNGDFNWVVPNKLMAFANPAAELPPSPPPAIYFLTPEELAPAFHEVNIKSVIRLNAPLYDSERFVTLGIEHHDLIFPDGSTPSIRIIDEFFRIVESCDGAVAVHCKGGFGRTGTLIACYMMKHHGFTAREAIGWIRLCRPGSIVGRQQQFLVTVEEVMRNPTKFAKILAKSQRVRQAKLLPPLTMTLRHSSTSLDYLVASQAHEETVAIPELPAKIVSQSTLSLSTPSMAALQECDANDDGVVSTLQLGVKRARDELVEESQPRKRMRLASVRVFSDAQLRIVQPGRYECDEVLDDDEYDNNDAAAEESTDSLPAKQQLECAADGSNAKTMVQNSNAAETIAT